MNDRALPDVPDELPLDTSGPPALLDPALTGPELPDLRFMRFGAGDSPPPEPPPPAPHADPSPNHPRSPQPPRSKALIITLAVSIGLHLAALTAVLLLLRGGVPAIEPPEKPTEVELVMEEHKGDATPTASPSQSPPSPDTTPSKQPTDAAPPPAEAQSETPAPPAKSPVDARPDAARETTEPPVASSPTPEAEPPPPQAQPQPQPATAATPPVPTPPPAPPTRAAPPAPTITLQGTDSPSDARAWGAHVIPASPDAVFHNRPPEYPAEAVLRGEHGTVVVIIHVSPGGTAAGVDVVRSSGYALLDGAVRVAVMRWRFLPAVRAGESIASDVTMGFIFDNQ